MKARMIRAGAALLVAGTMLAGCIYQPAPGYGYYGPGPAPAAVYVGGGWGWGWRGGCCWRR